MRTFKEEAKIEAMRHANSQKMGKTGCYEPKTSQELIKDAEVIYQWLIKGIK